MSFHAEDTSGRTEYCKEYGVDCKILSQYSKKEIDIIDHVLFELKQDLLPTMRGIYGKSRLAFRDGKFKPEKILLIMDSVSRILYKYKSKYLDEKIKDLMTEFYIHNRYIDYIISNPYFDYDQQVEGAVRAFSNYIVRQYVDKFIRALRREFFTNCQEDELLGFQPGSCALREPYIKKGTSEVYRELPRGGKRL